MQNKTLCTLKGTEAERWRRKWAAGGRKREATGQRGQTAPLGEARLPEERKRCRNRERRSSCGQTERGGKTFWDTEESDHHPSSCERAGIASQALCPRETSMSPLGTGKRRGSDGGSVIPRLHLDLRAGGEAVGCRPADEPCDSSHTREPEPIR